MQDTTNPEDIFNQVYGKEKSLPKKQYQQSKAITQSTVKVDEGIKTVEDRVINWQVILNNWRITIVQIEPVIIVICVVLGWLLSYTVNKCTGVFNPPWYVYMMAGVIVISWFFLLITEGVLSLIVLVKFITATAAGHYSMMWVIAVDGHTFKFFTMNVCKYPIASDIISGLFPGLIIGYIFKTFEESRAGKKL